MTTLRHLRVLGSTAVVLAMLASTSSAGELRFGFRNPNFGGNPFMGEFLINSAQLQNQHGGEGGGGGGAGGGLGGDGGIGADPISSFQFPNPSDFDTGTTVIVGAPETPQ